MKLYPIHNGNFKLDGGAMFGVVPKSLWSRTNPADDMNMCTWAMRSLLIEDGDRLMLIDCGIGDKQSEKFFSYYFLHGDHSLDSSLESHGFHRDQITDVFLTHLHFDHCGGAIEYNEDRSFLRPAFKNAKFWSNELHWKWATEPNAREKASFLSENILPIQESGQLNHIQRQGQITKSVFENMDVFFADGHTESQMIPMIHYKGKKLVFMADLLPSTGHIPLPYVMGYDTRPLLTLDEKGKFLQQAAEEEWVLFLEHDAVNECCTVQMTEKGVRLKNVGGLGDFF
ncbi:MBL fold metallo-hydrolase [Sanyastnella coralliicola]|uniref:MBL fold metallo-hydrolase n=1 Tax=Sanyastnella coralliicola TaxID=3069118 RepID=UPI0027B8C56E|nr:MBL fold metallo-hydrolase [Longitalea sp. SCSIO 12813]